MPWINDRPGISARAFMARGFHAPVATAAPKCDHCGSDGERFDVRRVVIDAKDNTLNLCRTDRDSNRIGAVIAAAKEDK